MRVPPRNGNLANILGSVCALPFEDKSFDFIYDTCLCYAPPENLDNAIAEMFRVRRVGVLFGGITADMTETVIEKHELFEGVQTLPAGARRRHQPRPRLDQPLHLDQDEWGHGQPVSVAA